MGKDGYPQPGPWAPFTLLDTDLYKLTMQQAVLQHFPSSIATYKFTNRAKNMKFTRACVALIQDLISQLANVSLSEEEYLWLQGSCPYFKPIYLQYLSNFRFNPSEQVSLVFTPMDEDSDKGDLDIEITGVWVETILYEVPLMSILSEAYFKVVDIDWNMDGLGYLTYLKGNILYKAGVALSEFGTRRRRSYGVQNTVVWSLRNARNQFIEREEEGGGALLGTSNVHFAQTLGLTPVGTIAHEWTMAIAALCDYDKPNLRALDLWEKTYPPSESNALHIALTDTFSSEVFFQELTQNPQYADRWRGLRQDSGNPIKYAYRARDFYQNLGIDISTKTIVFSDGLNVEKCCEIKKVCNELGINPSFGVGTSLTNDFRIASSEDKAKSKALNIVIKLATIDGRPCVKLSDEPSKHTGDVHTIARVKAKFGL